MTTGKFDILSKDFDLEECMAQAQQGNPDAQVSIAYCYILGINGLEEDESKGFEYAQQSANLPTGLTVWLNVMRGAGESSRTRKKPFTGTRNLRRKALQRECVIWGSAMKRASA